MKSRFQRPSTFAINARQLGYATTATLALILGGCSQSADLLPSAKVASAETTSEDDGALGPQTDLQKATKYWGQEYEKKPTELQPALNYARDLKALGEKRKAMSVLQQASLLHSDDKQLASEYGRLALDLDQVSIASQALAMADDPTNPDWKVVSARGTVFAKQGKYSEAIPYYERALTLSDNNPNVLNNLAMSYAMMGDAKKAENILRQASASGTATPKIKENLALVLSLQGRYDESKTVVAANGDSNADIEYLKKMVKATPVSMPSSADWATTASATPSATPASASNVWTTDISTSSTTPPKLKTAKVY